MVLSDFSVLSIAFARNLRLVPADCRRELGAVYWVDHHRCVNCCWGETWAPEPWMNDLGLARVCVNGRLPDAIRPSLPAMRGRPGWEYIDSARPRWHRQVICLREELEPIAQWLAEFVNRREGLPPLELAPTVVVLMAQEDDETVTSGYYWTRAAYAAWRRAEARRTAA